jgi:hypothetical protein
METQPAVEKRFIFHANAVALGAHIRRPTDFFVPAVASSCLPVTGGQAEVEVKAAAQNFSDLISFESAYTRAHGDFADTKRAADFTHGNYGANELPTNTFVEASLTGLRIAIPQGAGASPEDRVFLAKQLHVRMESTSDRRSPAAFRSLEATIDGVSVDGKMLKVKTVPEVFARNETKEKLCKTFEEDGDFRKQYSSLFFPTGEESKGLLGGLLGKHQIPQAKGTIFGTIVTGLEWEGQRPDRPTEIKGNQLVIEGIGTIYFGEIFIEENLRRLTLVRFQLGSPHGGEGSAVEAVANGGSWPPADIGN